MSAFQNPNHVHKHCIDSAQKQFERTSSTSKKPLGVHVRAVFDILLSQHRAFGAYEIARQLEETGTKLQAIQIYRVLDRLVGTGYAHRIESKNAYMACHGGVECRNPQLLICSSCEQVAEIKSEPIENSIEETAKSTGFVLQSQQVELFGLCPSCSE